MLERVRSPDELAVSSALDVHRILVPMKLGIIGEEMVATAVKLAADHGATVEALHVIRVDLSEALDAPLEDFEVRAAESLVEAKQLGADYGVTVEGATVRARAIGSAIVERAREVDADLIVLGSSPAVASPVAILLPDRRLRPAQRSVRGPDRRVPAIRDG